MSSRFYRFVILAFLAGNGLFVPCQVVAESWRVASNDCNLKILKQQRQVDSTQHPACHFLHLHAGVGTHALVASPVEPTIIIEELEIRQWVKSTKAPHQLMVHVVLPRTFKNGQPVSLKIGGTSNTQPGVWQQLTVPDILTKLDEQIRILRSELSDQTIDAREAFVDYVLINAYGGPGQTQLWLGQPEIEGSARAGSIMARPVSMQSGHLASRPVDVRRQSDVMLIDGRPHFLRMVRDHGEDWRFLRDLGFNTIRLANPATYTQLAEAEKLGIWLVSPPPREWPATTSRLYRRVIAWDGGERLTHRDVEDFQSIVRAFKRSDPGKRPFCVSADSATGMFAQDAELLIHDAISGESPARFYRRLKGQKGRLPGDLIHLASIPIEASLEEYSQIQSFGFAIDSQQIVVPPFRVEALAMAGLAGGIRGIELRTWNRLDGDHQADRIRALMARLINHQLLRIEPWLRAGRIECLAGEHPMSPGPTLFTTDRASLVALPPQQTDSSTQAITIPGAFGSTDIYCIGDSILRLGSQRVPGGICFNIPTPRPDFVVLSDQTSVMQKMAKQAIHDAKKKADLEYQLADLLVTRLNRLATGWADGPSLDGLIEDVERSRGVLSRCRDMIASRQFSAAASMAKSARETVERALQPRIGPNDEVTTPVGRYVETQNLEEQFFNSIVVAEGLVNLLPSGEFESTEQVENDGWYADGFSSAVPFSIVHDAGSPTGGGCLELDLGNALGREEIDIPMVMVSPPVATKAGQILRVHGMVKTAIPEVDFGRFSIYDSLGGLSLARCYDGASAANGAWRPFTFYRIVPDGGEWRLAFKLQGSGKAWIDGLSVSLVDPRSFSKVKPFP